MTDPKLLHVRLGFPRACPLDLAEETARLPVDIGLGDFSLDQALEGVKLGADPKHVVVVANTVKFRRQIGVLLTGHEAHAQEQALRTSRAERIEQLLPQGTHRPCVQQQHPVFVEPDLAFVDIETQPRAQVELLDESLLRHVFAPHPTLQRPSSTQTWRERPVGLFLWRRNLPRQFRNVTRVPSR